MAISVPGCDFLAAPASMGPRKQDGAATDIRSSMVAMDILFLSGRG